MRLICYGNWVIDGMGSPDFARPACAVDGLCVVQSAGLVEQVEQRGHDVNQPGVTNVPSAWDVRSGDEHRHAHVTGQTRAVTTTVPSVERPIVRCKQQNVAATR